MLTDRQTERHTAGPPSSDSPNQYFDSILHRIKLPIMPILEPQLFSILLLKSVKKYCILGGTEADRQPLSVKILVGAWVINITLSFMLQDHGHIRTSV